MPDEVVLVEKLDLPEGVSRKTHFLAIRKDMSVVAIEKTADMIAKAVATRKEKLAVKKVREEKKQSLALEKAQRKAKREEIKSMREDYKAKMEQMRKEQRVQKELLKSKLAKAKN